MSYKDEDTYGPLLLKRLLISFWKEEVGLKVSRITVKIVPDIYHAKIKKTSDQHLI